MNYGFYLAKQAGFEDFLFNTHHLPQEIERYAEKLRPMAQTLNISSENNEILGSAGAIWKARDLLKNHDYFLVANGDEILIPTDPKVLKHLVSQFHNDNSLCTLLTCEHPELLKTLKAVWVDKNNHVQGFGMDKPRDDLKPVHYTGYKVFSKKILDLIPPGESNIFYDVLIKAIAQGSTVTIHHLENCHWYETGNFNSFMEAGQTIVQDHLGVLNEIQNFFGQSIEVIRDDQGNQLVIPGNTPPPKELVFRGFNVLGANVKWQGPAVIENVVVCDQATINANADLKNTFVF